MKFRKIDPLRGFYLLLALAVFSRVVCDIFLGRWGIHTGNLFPYRHSDLIPLYSSEILLLEWALLIVGSLLLVTGRIRAAGFLITAGMLMSLSQMFQHQKFLMLIVAVVLAIQPLDPQKPHSLQFLRWQVLLVYLFSALEKIFNQFASGETLRLILEKTWHLNLNPDFYKAIAVIVIGIEFLIPVLLLKRPQWGVILVVIFHLVMSLMMKDLWPFAWVMMSLAVLHLQKNQNLISFVD